MVRITIDEALQKKLFSSQEIVELVDESGKLLGRLLPKVENPMEGWEPVSPPLSEEELQRRLASDEPGLSTKQVIEHLRSRT